MLFLCVCFLWNCTESDLTKQNLDLSELKSVLNLDSDYSTIVETYHSNFTIISSFEDYQSTRLRELTDKIKGGDLSKIEEFNTFLKETRINKDLPSYVASLVKKLDLIYTFKTEDLYAILANDTEKYAQETLQHSGASGRISYIVPPYDFGCSVYCAVAADQQYAASLEGAQSQIEMDIIAAEKGAYFLGCSHCCLSNCGN